MIHKIYSAEDLDTLKNKRLISKTQYRKFKQILNTTSFDYPKEVDTVRQVIRTISPLENAVGESMDDMRSRFASEMCHDVFEKNLINTKDPKLKGFVSEEPVLSDGGSLGTRDALDAFIRVRDHRLFNKVWTPYLTPSNNNKPTERVSHYKGTQAIDVAMEWELDTPLGNVLKYIQRNGKKSGESAPKDLVKAIDYILIHLGFKYPALREDVEMLRDQMSDMQKRIKDENIV